MSYIGSIKENVATPVYGYPRSLESFTNYTSIRVLCDSTLSVHRLTLTDEQIEQYGAIWDFFSGAGTPTLYSESFGEIDFQEEIDARTLLARTTAGFRTSAPVAVDSSINEIIIGDDYLAANGRAFSWTVDAVQGFVVGECVCKFGGRLDDDNTWLVTGSIVDNEDDTWTLSANLENTDTAALKEGGYLWSVEVEHEGVEVTRVKADCKTKLVRKQT